METASAPTKPPAPEDQFAELNAAIAAIYDAAIDAQVWPAALDRITALCAAPGWNIAALLWEHARTHDVRFHAALAIQSKDISDYASVFSAINPWTSQIQSLPLAEPVDTWDIAPPETLQGSDFYRGFLRRSNIERAVGVVVDRKGPENLIFFVPGPGGDRWDAKPALKVLRAVTPHLQRAVRINLELTALRVQVDDAHRALDVGLTPMIILGPGLAVLHANAKAMTLIEGGSGLGAPAGALRLHDNRTHAALRRLADGEGPPSLAFAIDRGDALDRLSALAVRVPGGRHAALAGVSVEGARAIVVIGHVSQPPLLPDDILRAWFGLTPAQARMAAQVFAGRDPRGCAEALGITVNTARWQLKRIFERLGVASQADLVRVLAATPWAAAGTGAPDAQRPGRLERPLPPKAPV